MEFTQLLEKAKDGDARCRSEVIQAVYDDLRRVAAAQMRDQANHTLSATALVHEVALRLLNNAELKPNSRRNFIAFAAKAMRNFLIDYARAKQRDKRGGDRRKLVFDEVVVAAETQPNELVELNEALEQLAEFDPRRSQVVELRYFGGMTVAETATALEISPATVKRDWEIARLWLCRALRGGDQDDT